MASVFWDEKGKYINSDYYIELLVRLKDEIAKKTTAHEEEKNHLSSRQYTVPQVNENDGKIVEIRLGIASPPTILSRSSPRDYWLFTDLKKMLQGKRFGSNEEVIAETEAYFEAKDKSFYKHGIEKLEKRRNDCIALKGDCIDE